ncbi:MAG: hypothetical protein LBG44_05410 [Gemmatimonadota bacterium]|nr:hypothetical protein [Gemmatimonadota bacterium]
MTTARRIAPVLALVVLLVATACTPRVASTRATTASSLNPPASFMALPDTLVCVIDRSVTAGLRQVSAKKRDGGVVLFVDGAVRPLESVHPVDYMAGYAGREQWVRDGVPVELASSRYVRTGGERRINLTLLSRVGEFRGIMLFAGRDEGPRPDAVYLPTSPGCIFQAYVRSDLNP